MNDDLVLAYLDEEVSEAEAALRYAEEFRAKAVEKLKRAREARAHCRRALQRTLDFSIPTPIIEEETDHD